MVEAMKVCSSGADCSYGYGGSDCGMVQVLVVYSFGSGGGGDDDE